MQLDLIRIAMAETFKPLGVQASAYQLSNPTPPTVWCYPQTVDYRQAMQNGAIELTMAVEALVGILTSDIGTQKTLDQLIDDTGPKSVKAALEKDVTLGGLVDTLMVVSCSGYKVYALPTKPEILGAEWIVKVIVSPA